MRPRVSTGRVASVKARGVWTRIASRQLLDCRVFRVNAVQARSPVDGHAHEFYTIDAPDWVQIVPVTSDQRIVMVRQWRHGCQRMTLEVPAGLVEADELPAAAARRECREETGFAAAAVHPLGTLNPNPAYFANRLHMFAAHGVESVGAIENSGTEQTSVELVPLKDIEALLLDGTVEHALAAAVLWRYLREIGR